MSVVKSSRTALRGTQFRRSFAALSAPRNAVRLCFRRAKSYLGARERAGVGGRVASVSVGALAHLAVEGLRQFALPRAAATNCLVLQLYHVVGLVAHIALC